MLQIIHTKLIQFKTRQ